MNSNSPTNQIQDVFLDHPDPEKRPAAPADLDAELDRAEFHDPELTEQAKRDWENRALTASSQERIEKAAQLHEDNVEAHRPSRMDRQDEITQVRLGRVMHMNEFLRRLRTVCPGAHYNDWSVAGMRGLNVVVGGERKYVCAVQNGVMPEFETLRTDEYGVATTSRYRGWRTVILNLIEKGHITHAQAERAFGQAGGAHASRFLREASLIRPERSRLTLASR